MQKNNTEATDTAPGTLAPSTANSNESRRSYSAPCIISAEKLEAAASTCSTAPGQQVIGKNTGIAGNACQTLGS